MMAPMREAGEKYHDRMITCIDCNGGFAFSAGEQDYYNRAGFKEPKRCKPCAAKRRASFESGDVGGTYSQGAVVPALDLNVHRAPYVPRGNPKVARKMERQAHNQGKRYHMTEEDTNETY